MVLLAHRRRGVREYRPVQQFDVPELVRTAHRERRPVDADVAVVEGGVTLTHRRRRRHHGPHRSGAEDLRGVRRDRRRLAVVGQIDADGIELVGAVAAHLRRVEENGPDVARLRHEPASRVAVVGIGEAVVGPEAVPTEVEFDAAQVIEPGGHAIGHDRRCLAGRVRDRGHLGDRRHVVGTADEDGHRWCRPLVPGPVRGVGEQAHLRMGQAGRHHDLELGRGRRFARRGARPGQTRSLRSSRSGWMRHPAASDAVTRRTIVSPYR